MITSSVDVVPLIGLGRMLSGHSGYPWILIPSRAEFTWSTDDQLTFLDNLACGLPFGQVVVWNTRWSEGPEDLECKVPRWSPKDRMDQAEGSIKTYLVDGYQRIESVFSALYGCGELDGEGREEICYNLETGAFVASVSKLPQYLPASAIMDSMNRWRAQLGFPSDASDQWASRADAVAARFHQILIPVVTLYGDLDIRKIRFNAYM